MQGAVVPILPGLFSGTREIKDSTGHEGSRKLRKVHLQLLNVYLTESPSQRP